VRLKTVFALVAFSGAIACADAATSPSRPNAPSAPPATRSTTVLDQAISVIPLQRTAPLASEQSVSARIGVFGGQLRLPDAGLTVTVPAFALVSPVTITVTAMAGSSVAYEFSPHGLTFLAPIVATQDLSMTEAQRGGLINPSSLFVGYFPDSSQITTVTELLSLQVDLLAQTSTALVWHFSGYMWSSGRESDSDSSGVMTIRRAPGAVERFVKPSGR
jgi:hypothetical protein